MFGNIGRAVGMFENIGEQAVIEGQLLEQVLLLFEGGHCVLKWGFTWTFPGDQDATLK